MAATAHIQMTSALEKSVESRKELELTGRFEMTSGYWTWAGMSSEIHVERRRSR